LWLHNKSSHGSSGGMNPMCLGRQRNSPSKVSQTNNLTSGYTRPLFNTKYDFFFFLPYFGGICC
jgi:hypothetical protein